MNKNTSMYIYLSIGRLLKFVHHIGTNYFQISCQLLLKRVLLTV